MKRVILIVITCTLGFAQAQTLEKKKIMLRKNGAGDKMTDFVYKYTAAQDEQNYYIFYRSGPAVFNGSEDKKYFVANKNLTTITKGIVLAFNKGEDYRSAFFTTNHLAVICDNYDKKKKEMNIILKRYAKKTGIFVSNTPIAKVKTPSWNPWYYSASSPDGTMHGVVFMAENSKEKFDEFHAFVLNNEGEILWKTTQKLQLSNELFDLKRIATSNDGKIYVIFSSAPNSKKSPDQMTYLDMTLVSEDENDHLSIPLNKKDLYAINMSTMKNGNLFFACLFSEGKESHPTHLQTIMFDAGKFDIINNTNSEIPKMETKSKVVMPMMGIAPSRFNYGMSISGIKELENGEIAIVCEQAASIVYTREGSRMPFYVRGDIMTAFANKEGVVEHYHVYDRFQKGTKSKYLSCGVFTMENQVCYLFNDHPDRFKGKDATFDGNNSNNAVIACNKISNGNPAETVFITDKIGKADKCFQNILLKDENKLLIITGNNNTMDLEILSLKE
jgi:hypothetical protein